MSRRWPERPGVLKGLVCERCGSVIPADDGVDWVLRRLARLSRFGLGGDDRPLLSVRRPFEASE